MAGVSAKVHNIDGKHLVIESGGTLDVKSGATVTGLSQVPTTGTTGHVLTKTSTGAEFAAIPATPDASTSEKGLVKMAEAQADSTASTVAGTVTDFNALLAKLRTAGLLATE